MYIVLIFYIYIHYIYTYTNIIINFIFVRESLRCFDNNNRKNFFMKPMMENKYSCKISGKNFVKPLFKQKFVFGCTL